MIEEWRPVKNFEGLYEVSNLGNVRSLNWRNTGTTRNLKPRLNNKGYYDVLLSRRGHQYRSTVHRLVARAFIPCENESMTVNHKDENTKNNRVDNLEWCSLKQNITKYQDNNPDKVGRPENFTPVRQIDKNGKVIKIWKSAAEVHRILKYSIWSISQCCNGKRKTAYGYSWQYAT